MNKRNMKKLLNILLVMASSHGYSDAVAQEVKNFELIDVMSNEKVSLETFPSCEGLLVIFTSNSCPYDEYYRKRINALAQAYRDRVPVLLVNSHTDPKESPARMAEKGKELNL